MSVRSFRAWDDAERWHEAALAILRGTGSAAMAAREADDHCDAYNRRALALYAKDEDERVAQEVAREEATALFRKEVPRMLDETLSHFPPETREAIKPTLLALVGMIERGFRQG